jgi:hypothetical protein
MPTPRASSLTIAHTTFTESLDPAGTRRCTVDGYPIRPTIFAVHLDATLAPRRYLDPTAITTHTLILDAIRHT